MNTNMIIIVIWGDGGSLQTIISVIIVISPSSLSSSSSLSSHRHLQTERVAFQTRCRASSRCRTAGAACSGRSPNWCEHVCICMMISMIIIMMGMFRMVAQCEDHLKFRTLDEARHRSRSPRGRQDCCTGMDGG